MNSQIRALWSVEAMECHWLCVSGYAGFARATERRRPHSVAEQAGRAFDPPLWNDRNASRSRHRYFGAMNDGSGSKVVFEHRPVRSDQALSVRSNPA
jgi:hypothetical protein